MSVLPQSLRKPVVARVGPTAGAQPGPPAKLQPVPNCLSDKCQAQGSPIKHEALTCALTPTRQDPLTGSVEDKQGPPLQGDLEG